MTDSKRLLLLSVIDLRARQRRPPARDFEHTGLGAILVDNRPDREALKERAARDIFRKLLDRDARL
jgi:hypothetical protein